jgi:hypothetical protein
MRWQILPVRGGGAGRLRWSGKSARPREASPRWMGALGPAHEDGRCVRRFGTDVTVETEVRRDRGGLLKEGSGGGMDKMNGRLFFYSRALRVGNAGLCKEREREVMAQRGGRVTGVHVRAEAQRQKAGCMKGTRATFVYTSASG